ncbi:hypothetical protein LZ31DRAFT_177135 [Colletotrichum somersetense]|nr:hypothetical protein LZ31DRAFT_177135 [Colletotrichum somersetense]
MLLAGGHPTKTNGSPKPYVEHLATCMRVGEHGGASHIVSPCTPEVPSPCLRSNRPVHVQGPLDFIDCKGWWSLGVARGSEGKRHQKAHFPTGNLGRQTYNARHSTIVGSLSGLRYLGGRLSFVHPRASIPCHTLAGSQECCIWTLTPDYPTWRWLLIGNFRATLPPEAARLFLGS